MPQIKILHGATKTQHSQINKIEMNTIEVSPFILMGEHFPKVALTTLSPASLNRKTEFWSQLLEKLGELIHKNEYTFSSFNFLSWA